MSNKLVNAKRFVKTLLDLLHRFFFEFTEISRDLFGFLVVLVFKILYYDSGFISLFCVELLLSSNCKNILSYKILFRRAFI